MTVTFRGGTCGSSANSHGRRRSEGIGRVMSGITTATRSPARTISRSDFASIGRRTASRNAAASSGTPATNRGSITVTSDASVVSSRPSVPYCRRTHVMEPMIARVLESRHVLWRRRSAIGLPHTRPAISRWALILAGILLAVGCQQAEQPASAPKAGSAAPASFAGSAKCAGCHPRETEAFRGSDHARAMQPATEQTVLGHFDQSRITHQGVTSTFFRRDGKFFVHTDGPDGKLGEFEITYTFGVTPLQQYLVPFPDGRLQALGLAWDTRPPSQGGQRWFPLYPGQTLRAPNPLHWTGREQTWNFQCAECHSTDLRKRYELATNRYATTWAELTISCEECHGPGSAHVAWAEAHPPGASRAGPGATGLVVRLGRGDGAWAIKDPQRGIAEWTGPPRTLGELDVCARCHSRRRPIVDPHPYGRPFLDTHVPALLEAQLYHADGQILGEVYEWGSFVQSRMQRAGVTCSDCHEPHRATLRAAGNAVCAQCHLPAKFDTPTHHHHRSESDAARCVSCHMPARTYMVVDPRRDHSFRVPRPDLSVTLGTPNACTGCHRDRPPQWAADRVAAWGGPHREAGFAAALDAARRGRPEAAPALTALATDPGQPAISRATALAHFPEFWTAAMAKAVESALGDGDALVRMVALQAAGALPPERRAPLAAPLLRDPIRAVRLAAVQTLAGGHTALADGPRADFECGVSELVQSELVNADRPEAHLNLANLYGRLGRPADAESELRTALWLDPAFIPALVNLADLLRTQGRDADGERFLEQALRAAPDNAEALHALALLRVRQTRLADAVDLLRRAARARPDAPRFAYVYAVALHDTGRARDAITVLEGAHHQRPADRDILTALATYLGERGDVKQALAYAEKLAALDPTDGAARTLVETLRRHAGAG
jgi:predicted CXXCH cytochrome family protein